MRRKENPHIFIRSFVCRLNDDLNWRNKSREWLYLSKIVEARWMSEFSRVVIINCVHHKYDKSFVWEDYLNNNNNNINIMA